MFTRLLYYGVTVLGFTANEVWYMPFGMLLDLWECHKQYTGQTKAKRERFIEDIIPDGI